MPCMQIVEYLLIDFLILFSNCYIVCKYIFLNHSVISKNNIYIFFVIGSLVNSKFSHSQGIYFILLWCPFISSFEAKLNVFFLWLHLLRSYSPHFIPICLWRIVCKLIFINEFVIYFSCWENWVSNLNIYPTQYQMRKLYMKNNSQMEYMKYKQPVHEE